jgi:hypothetical protein
MGRAAAGSHSHATTYALSYEYNYAHNYAYLSTPGARRAIFLKIAAGRAGHGKAADRNVS